MILGKTELTKLIDEVSLVSSYIAKDAQLQVNGFEMTARKVETFDGPGRIGFDNADRSLPAYNELPWGEDGWLFLSKGTYKVTFNEVVAIPKDMCAIALPRSSLLRAGVSVHTAVWDAGYRGRSEAMLVVYNDNGFYLKKDARVLQLLFMTLPSSQQGYSGRYLNENI